MDSKLTLDYQISGVYRYAYTAQGTGEHAGHFKTISTTTNETVLIDSDLFDRATIQLAEAP